MKFKRRRNMRLRSFILPVFILGSGLLLAGATKDCVFLNNPSDFPTDSERLQSAQSDLTARVAMYVSKAVLGDQAAVQTLDAARVPRKNMIDDAIFGRMVSAGIRSAPIASDVEFLRRVTLDLTGRIPSGADVLTFMADTNPGKREAKIDKLIGSPEFVDKWTMFFGDLFKVNAQSSNINR